MSSKTLSLFVWLVAGFGYGNHDSANFSMTQKINLNPGNNTLDVLSMMIGLQVKEPSQINS